MEVIFMLKAEELKLVSEWDKTFPKSEKVDHEKVTFVNRYGITLAADLYKPKNASGKYPAIAVSGPFGAVKEQCSGRIRYIRTVIAAQAKCQIILWQHNFMNLCKILRFIVFHPEYFRRSKSGK